MTAGDRHSSNTNDRGSAEARRRRKNWLLRDWGADVDVVSFDQYLELATAFVADGVAEYLFDLDIMIDDFYWDSQRWISVQKGLGRPACRCFRCGTLLTFETMEVDKIISKATKTARFPNGGTYVRDNIRPVCPGCNKTIAGEERRRRNAKRKKRNEQARTRRRAAKVVDALGPPQFHIPHLHQRDSRLP